MKKRVSTLSWGIIGTGNIARTFAKGLKGSKTGKLLGIASRSLTTAHSFGEEFDVPVQYGNYEDLLANKDIQAVYIALPHPLHSEWAIRIANAGKHILCEKPLTMTYFETLETIEAARRNDVFLMEAYMYRCHPQTTRLVDLIREKIIGDVRVIQATFSFHADFSPLELSLQKQRGGGGIMDVGGYPISMVRLIAGTAIGQNFVEPTEVYGTAHLGKLSQVDEWAIGCLKFPEGIVAQVSAGTSIVQENALRIFGSEGDIYVPSPWVPGGREPGTTKIFVRKKGKITPEIILTKTKRGLYSLEADIVAAYLDKRQAPTMTWEDTLGNMKTLDRWRKAVGVLYPADARQ